MSTSPFHAAMAETFDPIFGEADKTGLDTARGIEFSQQVLIRLAEYDAAEERIGRAEDALMKWLHGLVQPKVEALAKSRLWFESTYLPKLEAEARLLLAEQRGKKKSIDTLVGSVGFRHQADEWTWAEDDELLEWCRKNCPSAIKIKESVSHTELKHYFESSGDLPPGCSVVARDDKFYAKPIGPELMRLEAT